MKWEKREGVTQEEAMRRAFEKNDLGYLLDRPDRVSHRGYTDVSAVEPPPKSFITKIDK